MLQTDNRAVYDEDMNLFRDQVRKFFDKALTPHLDRWEEEGLVDRAFWLACGEAGLLCPTVPTEYGGLGLDFRYNAVIDEELAYAGSSAGITLQSDIVAEYIVEYGSEEQKQHWLPKMVSGEAITAIAMTEPGTGSDLQGVRTTAKRDGNEYVINGSKIYITNGQNADLVIVVAKTNPDAGSKGISLPARLAGAEGQAAGRLGAPGLGDRAPPGRQADRRRSLGRQALPHRAAMGDLRRGPAAAWRRRLHERVSDRPPVAGRAGAADLRRHLRDHEGSGRPHDLSGAVRRATR